MKKHKKRTMQQQIRRKLRTRVVKMKTVYNRKKKDWKNGEC